MILKALQRIPLPISRRAFGYLGLAALFFLISFGTVYFIHHYVSGERLWLPPNLFSAGVVSALALLLILYFVADGLRLYCVIRALGFRIAFPYVIKLVFANMFVSNVTPLATGGGVIQVYFMNRQGMPVGEATAATSIRTILAALIFFMLTPLIIWAEPDQFRMFMRGNLLYLVTGVSCLYLLFFWLVLRRVKTLKRWLLSLLNLLDRMNVLSRPRLRLWYLKISVELELFANGFKRYFWSRPGWALLSVIFTVVFLLLLFSFSVVLIRALGYQVPILTVLAFQLVVTFFMYFAPTPGAAGVAEGGYGLLFSQLVARQDIAPLILSWRFLTIYVGVVIGILVMFHELFKTKKVGRS